MDAIYGVTKELLAETMGKDGEIRAKFGAREAEGEFDAYLASKGLDRNTWALAHNGWLDRFRADPTGRAEAEFHVLLQQESQKAHFADVRDMSQDTVEGITLDQYAQIVVAVSRRGADADAIVRQFGLQDVEHWQRANAAWTAKMGADTTHALTMQYGQLYQKHAGPQFQEEMVAQTAAILAKSNEPRDVVDEPEVELTPELCLEKMKSPSRNERWRYAYLYANMADLGNVPDKPAAVRAVSPILLEMIERHDEDTTSDAERGITRLWDLEVKNDDVRGAVARCLSRAQEKLTSLQAAFAPIRDQAVPERLVLQSKIQSYTSLVETMQDYSARDWTRENVEALPSTAGFAASTSPSTSAFAPNVSRGGGGFPKWLIAPAALVLVGGALFATRAKDKPVTSPASTTAASVAAASAATPKEEAAPAAAPAKPVVTAATAAPAKAVGPKKKK